MKAQEYFDEAVKKVVTELLSTPILNQLADLNKKQLRYFFSQIYYFVDAFPGYLGILLWKTNNNSVRFTITENLVDEYGGIEKIMQRDFAGMHSNLLKKFVEKIDPSVNGLADQSKHTKALLTHFNDLFISASLIEALAAMASMENIAPPWFDLLYNQLKQRNTFSNDDLYFFKLHMSIDVEHGDVLKETLIPLLKDEKCYALLQRGIDAAASNWQRFYEGITQEMAMLLSCA